MTARPAIEDAGKDSPSTVGVLAMLGLFVAYLLGVTVVRPPDNGRFILVGLGFSVAGIVMSSFPLFARRPAHRLTTWRTLWTTMWPVPLAFLAIVVTLPVINDNTMPGSVERRVLYAAAGVLTLVDGVAAFLWWMRQSRRVAELRAGADG